MIYLDNAATTFPKPAEVRQAVSRAVLTGANPGRSGHDMALRASETIYRCRAKAAEMFGAESPENIIFTPGCTYAANMVIKGLLKKGDHAVVSDLEHNAVMRPLYALAQKGVSYTAVKTSLDDDETLSAFRDALTPNTRLVICTHVSNVWGIRLPVERIAAMCRQYGIPIMIDAAQSAGVFPINAKESGFDFVCVPGHKGLYGPMGVGILIARRPELLDTIVEGGTGSGSRSLSQPEFPPDKFESGTPNHIGIAGLSAGLDFVKRIGLKRISEHEARLCAMLYDRLQKSGSVILYTPRPDGIRFSGVLSFNIRGRDSESAAALMNDRYGIAVRAGLHCAPAAHEHFSTADTGAVRVSVSYFTTPREIAAAANAIISISRT